MSTTIVAPPKQPTPPPRPSRMSLGALVKGKLKHAKRIMVYGPEGVGKSTFGANAPNAVFLGAEDGTASLDVTRFPAPENWREVLDAVHVLTSEQHRFETLVLDTLDWAEPMLWDYICARDSQGRKEKLTGIEDYGYGKGYTAAVDEWRVLLNLLEQLRKAKQMNVVLLAHSWVKPFKNPEGEDYDRYELKLNNKASGLLKEWCDVVLFANYETFAVEDKRTKRVKGVDNEGARIVHTQRRAAFDAKNRYNLPETLPLSWVDFVAAVERGESADPATMAAEIERKAKEVGGAVEKNTLESLARVKDDPSKLAQLNNWITAKLAEKA